MIQKLKLQKQPILAFVFTSIILAFFYYPILLHPNDFLFSANGDGIKNYYTYLFHARYDAGFAEFTGMNYPFNEHIVYTDAHPLLSYIIGKLGLVGYGIGILNILMLISYPIAAVFVQRILHHFKVTSYWSIIPAIVITFLSPQVFRLTGHYSMSYVFAIPIMWWLLIKVNQKNPWVWSIITAIYLTVFFFTHPYLGIIMAFLSAFYTLVFIVIKRKNWGKRILLMLVQICIPFIVFQGYILLTDTHTGRLSNPAGFFHYYANWKSILVPHDGPLAQVFRSMDVRIGTWEAWAYVGLYAVVFGVFIIVYSIKRRKEINWKHWLHSELTMFFIAAYLILLFAFCFPLKFDWMRWVVDAFGPLKQFRILGRFTWVFYYVGTVAAVVGFYNIQQRNPKKYLTVTFALLMVFSVFEFYPVHFHTSRAISSGKNTFLRENVSPDLENMIQFVEDEEYDAFIFLPFNHMSSENLMILGSEEANRDAFLLSYHGGLPMINSVSSRMSITEAAMVNNFFSREFIEKEFAYRLPKDAKIAIVKRHSYIKPDEMRMIWNSEKKYQNDTYSVLDYNSEKWNTSEYFEEVLSAEKEAIHPVGSGWAADTSAFIIYESFDDGDSSIAHMGTGSAFKGNKRSWNTIYSVSKDELPVGEYVVKFWYHYMIDRPDVMAVVEQVSDPSKPSTWASEFDVKQSTNIVDDWCLVEMEFDMTDTIEQVNFLLTGNGNEKPFIVDELLIQKRDGPDVFRKDKIGNEDYLIYNNYWIRLNSFSH